MVVKSVSTYTMLLCGVLLFCLLAVPVTATSGDELKGVYATLLIELAGSDDYVIHCGDVSVLNRRDLLPELPDSGYPQDPAVCTATFPDSNKRLVVFATKPDLEPAKVIEHIANYNNQQITTNPRIIHTNDINADACLNPQDVGRGTSLCPNAFPNHNVDVYLRIAGSEEATYLVAFEFPNTFDFTGQGFFSQVRSFLRTFFGLGEANTFIQETKLESFTQGYFAKVAQGNQIRTVKGLFHEESDTTAGSGTLIFTNFSFNIQSFAPQAHYSVGSNNRQILVFDELLLREWREITASLRIHPQGTPLVFGALCGNGRLDFAEDCEPTSTGFLANNDAQTCSDLGGNFAQGTLQCNADCTFNVQECVTCQDADQDQYYSALGASPELTPINTNTLIGLGSISTYDTQNTNYNQAKTQRTTNGVGAQILPLAIDYFANVEVLDSSFPELLRTRFEYFAAQSAACDAKTTLEEQTTCYTQVLSTDAKDHVSLIASFMTADMLSNPVRAQTYGQANGATLASILSTLDTENIRPYFSLQATSATTQDFELALTCASLGKALANTLGASSITLPAKSFIYKTSATSPQTIYNEYHICKSGLNAVGADFELYVDVSGKEQDIFTHLLSQYEQNPSMSLFQGILTSDPEKFVLNQNPITTPESLAYSTLLNNKPILVQATQTTDNTQTLKNLLSAVRAQAQVIFYNDVQGSFVANPELKNIHDNISAVDVVYLPTQKSLEPVVVVFGDPFATIYIANSANTPTHPSLPDFGACTDANVRKFTNNAFAQTSTLPSTLFASSGTAVNAENTIFEIYVNDRVCFLNQTVFTGCAGSGMALDCNDADPAISPVAAEICSDTIDNDCDGLVDEVDSCQEQPVFDAGTASCNYNAVCESLVSAVSEDRFMCSDCFNRPLVRDPITGTATVTRIDYEGSSQGCEFTGSVTDTFSSVTPRGCTFSGNTAANQAHYYDDDCNAAIVQAAKTACSQYDYGSGSVFVSGSGPDEVSSPNSQGTITFYEPAAVYCARITHTARAEQHCIAHIQANPSAANGGQPTSQTGYGFSCEQFCQQNNEFPLPECLALCTS